MQTETKTLIKNKCPRIWDNSKICSMSIRKLLRKELGTYTIFKPGMVDSVPKTHVRHKYNYPESHGTSNRMPAAKLHMDG